MKLFAFDEWSAANADYDGSQPEIWHAKIVPEIFAALGGVFWSVSYIVMIFQNFKDQSYSMPVYCLCMNIAWETVFGFVYPPGLLNQMAYLQWLVIDVFLVYTTVVFGKQQWRHQPLVANNLGSIIFFGCIFCMLLHLAIAATYVPLVGRQVVTFTGWTLQVFLSIGYDAQLLSRGHTKGHSWAIWSVQLFPLLLIPITYIIRCTRVLGTLMMTLSCCWLGVFWYDKFAYLLSPYFIFLFASSHLFDLLYPLLFQYLNRRSATAENEAKGKSE